MKNYLTIEDIYSSVCALAQSQVFYGRMKTFMEDNWEVCEEEWGDKFVDIVDFILYLEC